MHTIKNLSLNVGKYSNFGLIGIVKNEIRNINFENIQINNTDESPINSLPATPPTYMPLPAIFIFSALILLIFSPFSILPIIPPTLFALLVLI